MLNQVVYFFVNVYPYSCAVICFYAFLCGWGPFRRWKKVISRNIIITDIDNQNNIVFSVMIHPKN